MIEAKTRLLNTAERLFIDRGFTGTSLRAITADARVNLAAVNYYFRSKEVLFQEVLSRRLQPVNERRLNLLDAAEAAASGAAVPVERIVEAFLIPLLGCPREAGHSNRLLRRLVGRVHAEPAECVQRILVVECRTVLRRFAVALERALPHLPPNEIAVRLQFMIGILVQTLAGAKCEDGAFREASSAEVFRQMAAFITAALQAPATASIATGSSRQSS